MPLFILVHLEHDSFVVALFEGTTCWSHQRFSKSASSAMLPAAIAHLLAGHGRTLKDLNFIAAGRGPGPFTTVRTLLAGLNGIAFGAQLPAVGINSLEVLLHSNAPTAERPVSIALINAFQREMYVGVAQQTLQNMHMGYAGVPELLALLKRRYPDTTLTFCGDGAGMLAEEIRAVFGHYAQVAPKEYAPLQVLGTLALHAWHDGKGAVQELTPLYLRDNPTPFVLPD